MLMRVLDTLADVVRACAILGGLASAPVPLILVNDMLVQHHGVGVLEVFAALYGAGFIGFAVKCLYNKPPGRLGMNRPS
jgi:hypothetical protein